MPNRFEPGRDARLQEISLELGDEIRADLDLLGVEPSTIDRRGLIDKAVELIVQRLAAHGMSDTNIRAALKLRPPGFKPLTPKG